MTIKELFDLKNQKEVDDKPLQTRKEGILFKNIKIKEKPKPKYTA